MCCSDVGEQWSDDAALRRAPRTPFPTQHAAPSFGVPFLDGHFQPRLHKVEHVPVRHAARDTLQQLVMRNGVEILRQVGIDDIRVSLAQRRMELGIHALTFPIDFHLAFRPGMGRIIETSRRYCSYSRP